MKKNIKELQDIYDKYGVNSKQFYNASKDLINYAIHRNLHGYKYSPDFFNECYKELILAFNGGITTHYNKIIYKKPIFGKKQKTNIASFIFKVVQSAMSKYINKVYRKDRLYLNRYFSIEDIAQYESIEYKTGGVLCA